MPPPSPLSLNQSLKSKGWFFSIFFALFLEHPCLENRPDLSEAEETEPGEGWAPAGWELLVPPGFQTPFFHMKGNECPSNLISDTEFGTFERNHTWNVTFCGGVGR